jgi:hypothetical protein
MIMTQESSISKRRGVKTVPCFFLVFFLLFALAPTEEALAGSPTPGGTVPVCGYTGCNGTCVVPYVRRAPGTAN